MSSEFEYYGLGTVAKDKSTNSKEIAVFPVEQLPFASGEITTEHITEEFSGVDVDGNEYKAILQSGMTIKAIWVGDGNRITAPNVKKGEQVKLYQVGKTGRFYWEEMGRDNHLRRGETITWAFSASLKPTEQQQAPLPNNQYSFTVDGINGHISLTTTTANKEKAGYKAQFNGKNGCFTIVDTYKNLMQMDSVNYTISCRNGMGSHLTIKSDVVIAQNKTGSFIRFAGDMIDAQNKTGSKVVIKGDVITVKNATGTSIVINGDDVTIHGGGTLNLDMPKVVVKDTLEVGNKIVTKEISLETINGIGVSSYLNR